jgi:hypothetical protein
MNTLTCCEPRFRYRDVNRAAFMDQARKLIPSVTDDMVEESFSGVMSQVSLLHLPSDNWP